MRAKPLLFDALDARFGSRTPRHASSTNHGFHVLEHPETLWLKHFTSYLCKHLSVTSLIWLHDGIWLSPTPSLTLIQAANRHASASIGLAASPLEFRLTSCHTLYLESLTPLLQGGPLPIDPPSNLSPPSPALHPPLTEQLARESFQRMMQRTALPSTTIVIDD